MNRIGHYERKLDRNNRKKSILTTEPHNTSKMSKSSNPYKIPLNKPKIIQPTTRKSMSKEPTVTVTEPIKPHLNEQSYNIRLDERRHFTTAMPKESVEKQREQ